MPSNQTSPEGGKKTPRPLPTRKFESPLYVHRSPFFFGGGQRALRNWLMPNNAVIQPKNRGPKVPYFSFVLKTKSELGALEQRRPLMHQHLPITPCWVCMRNPALMLSTKRNSPADNQINCYISSRPSFRRYGDGLPLTNFCSGIAPT